MDLTSRNRTLASFIPMSNIDRDRVPCVRSNTIYFTVIKTPGHTRLKTETLQLCAPQLSGRCCRYQSISAFVFLSAPASSNLSFLYLREDWDEYSNNDARQRAARQKPEKSSLFSLWLIKDNRADNTNRRFNEP